MKKVSALSRDFIFFTSYIFPVTLETCQIDTTFTDLSYFFEKSSRSISHHFETPTKSI
ncbi:MAG: hypothetical protein BWY04_00016 [candidate division CPR1 bacterium ADurb.Bin160]|uniref:Uncharacterized protein n=1 Tax=candidate division CPR1 bacterium ADurb.Bin160 TaxID=1852826 RepID=A0A1V5ZQH4_9BACT|nr:MAG: hypothetical protein BWY04_00016 [candidate division CPR1 bacterium ADurb.Bin160]